MWARLELRRHGGGSRVQRQREAVARKAGNPAARWDPTALPSRLAAPCVQPAHAAELVIPAGGRGAEGARGGGGEGRRWARPLADCAPSLRFAQVVGGPPPPPSTGRCSHRRGCRRRSRKPDARQRPTSWHFEASSCMRMLAVKDQGRPGAGARRC
jgi:hypothetical protein